MRRRVFYLDHVKVADLSLVFQDGTLLLLGLMQLHPGYRVSQHLKHIDQGTTAICIKRIKLTFKIPELF